MDVAQGAGARGSDARVTIPFHAEAEAEEAAAEASGLSQVLSASGDIQNSTGVPPQLLRYRRVLEYLSRYGIR